MTENEMLKIAAHCLGVQAEQEACEECPVYRESGIVCKEIARTVIAALKEIQQYREIGTVEECWKAVGKQEPKNPEIYTDTVQTINGSFQRDVFECPVCGEYICNVEDEIPRYCSSCGQKLEESEEDDE